MGESADEDFRSVLFLDNWGSKKAQAPPRKSLRENIKRRRPTSELARGSLTRGWNCGGFFAWLSTTAEDQPIEAPAYITEIRFVTSFKLSHGTARIAYIGESLPHRSPIYIPVTQVHPGVPVFPAFEIFEVNLDDAFAESMNPVLRIPIKQHVTHVEPSFYPRALRFTNVVGHLERAQEKLVPNFLDGDNNSQFLGKWNQRANLFLRTRPGIMVGRLRIHYRRDEQHCIRTPELGVVQRSAHSREALLHDRAVARRQWIFPMIHVHHGVDADVRRLSGFLDFLDLALVRLRWHLRDFEADVSRQFEAVADAQLCRQHFKPNTLLDGKGGWK